ncbi:hypothetical protein [Shewanella khirikhana]|uniref:Uncharacterized protein n=1 Tax=Shewanella khirikhana TaxID=1965282 RepID=A0ABM7D1H6_9GAMM|nr:hypothetical protein [Shewanella khirikhana]AZQ10131.1 hypothetical protein STH12_00995 [Shewanella khirikhana]
MSKQHESSVTLTLRQLENGLVEIACEVNEGGSGFLNKAAHHVGENLPVHVSNTLIDFVRKNQKQH